MSQTTPALIGIEIARLSSVYANVKATAVTAGAWFDVLHDLPVEDVQLAVRRFMRTDDPFPIPGVIRRIALEIAEDRQRQQHGVKLGHSTVYGKIEEQRPPIDPEVRKQIVAMLEEKALKFATGNKPTTPRREYEPQAELSADQSDALQRLKAAAEFHRQRAAKGGTQ